MATCFEHRAKRRYARASMLLRIIIISLLYNLHRVFKRLDERVAAAAVGSDQRAKLRRFARRLRVVADEIGQHAATLSAFEETPAGEWEALAVRRRADLTTEFFEFLETLAAAAGDDMARREGVTPFRRNQFWPGHLKSLACKSISGTCKIVPFIDIWMCYAAPAGILISRHKLAELKVMGRHPCGNLP